MLTPLQAIVETGLSDQLAGLVDVAVENWVWIVIFVLTVRFLGYYLDSRARDPNPIVVAAEAVRREVRMNSRRFIAFLGFVAAATFLLTKIVLAAVPELVMLDPTTWTAVVTIVVSGLKSLGVAIPGIRALALIGGVALTMVSIQFLREEVWS